MQTCAPQRGTKQRWPGITLQPSLPAASRDLLKHSLGPPSVPGTVRSWASSKGDDGLGHFSMHLRARVRAGWHRPLQSETHLCRHPSFLSSLFSSIPPPSPQCASVQHPQALLGPLHARVCTGRHHLPQTCTLNHTPNFPATGQAAAWVPLAPPEDGRHACPGVCGCGQTFS